MTPYQKLQELRNEVLYGTCTHHDNKLPKDCNTCEYFLEKECFLQDILRMIDEDEEIEVYQQVELNIINGAAHYRISIDLTKSIEEQSDEVLNSIIEIVK